MLIFIDENKQVTQLQNREIMTRLGYNLCDINLARVATITKNNTTVYNVVMIHGRIYSI